MKKQFPLALAALIALASLVQAGDDSAGRGAALLGPFKAKLKGALVAGMQEGPANAIEVCREDAPAIAAALSVDGVLMGRSSHRLRNRDIASAPDMSGRCRSVRTTCGRLRRAMRMAPSPSLAV